MRFTATRNASSAASPAWTKPAIYSRKWFFQLGDIDGVNRLSAPQIAAPLAYLLLQRCRFTLSRHR